MKTIVYLILTAILICTLTASSFAGDAKSALKMPNDFVDITEVVPDVILDIRYFTDHNFVAERLPGYEAPKCLLTKKAANALAKVQAELNKFNLSLKIYDCYRPQRAVDRFISWAEDINDVRTKKEFYPEVDKRNLFKDGYIASRSGHTRGSTVDVAIVRLPVPKQADYKAGEKLYACTLPTSKRFKDNMQDFGTGYDCFDELSHPSNMKVGVEQRTNRLLLQSLMDKYGFDGSTSEWWHFKMRDEPYPNTYFDFAIE